MGVLPRNDEIDGVDMIDTALVEANALANEFGIRRLLVAVTDICDEPDFGTFDLSSEVGCLRARSSESLLPVWSMVAAFCCGGNGINEFCSRILFGI